LRKLKKWLQNNQKGNKVEQNFDYILKHFEHSHIPNRLALVSKNFSELAHQMALSSIEDGADSRETAAGLRKLLEAKDCAVRALV
jgi:hypothetical protein